jgi:hypothetical protein
MDNGVGQMSDESALRERARELIQAGTLPDRRPDRMWGGPGSGANCAICSTPAEPNEVEFEIEFARNGKGSAPDTYHVHARCLAAWGVERHNLEPGRRVDGEDR